MTRPRVPSASAHHPNTPGSGSVSGSTPPRVSADTYVRGAAARTKKVRRLRALGVFLGKCTQAIVVLSAATGVYKSGLLNGTANYQTVLNHTIQEATVWMTRGAKTLSTMYVGVLGLMYVFQRKLVFFNNPELCPPAQVLQGHYPGLRDVSVTTVDGETVRGYAWDPPG